MFANAFAVDFVAIAACVAGAALTGFALVVFVL